MGYMSFGNRFNPADYKGPCARYHPEREDLFQQLIGAFFKARFGCRAHISATKGKDGGIDIYIEQGEDTEERFEGLKFPIIIDCKDHDDTLSNVTRNIQEGWRKVKQNIWNYNENNFTGLSRPWKEARSYLYCISPTLSGPQTQIDLSSEITTFFNSLNNLAPTPSCRVLSWLDLIPLLNTRPSLSDDWLGIDFDRIMGHAAYAESLTGFRAHLKEESIPFSFMYTDPLAQPQRLMEEIRGGRRGILIKGAGGVGKTRTCFEVANKAHAEGYRVLHVQPGEPAVTMDDLADYILRGMGPTLIVVDYIDQFISLDLGTMDRTLFRHAEERGIQLSFLANARPGPMRKSPKKDHLSAIFTHTVDLELGGRQGELSEHILRHVAPLSFSALGLSTMRSLCGERPIIGIFIAQELERYAKNGSLEQVQTSPPRPGDLIHWIKRRLREDGLSVQEDEPLMPGCPSPVMTAAAVALGASPLSDNEMRKVISDCLATCDDTSAVMHAKVLINTLRQAGWLEQRDIGLSSPHDAVTDELLTEALADTVLAVVRPGIVTRILSPGLKLPRYMGRISVSLDRVLGQDRVPEILKSRLSDALTTWINERSNELQETFRATDSDIVSYSLGAMIAGRTWGHLVLERWDDIVAPWLETCTSEISARHILYRGLEVFPEGKADGLLRTAEQWLQKYDNKLEAGYVLHPLLARNDLGDKTRAAIDHASAWLDRHGTVMDAQFVLHPLLARNDLGDKTRAAIDHASAWLDTHGKTIGAGYVLHPLLARNDLGDKTRAAIDHASAWLDRHGTVMDAQFVLHPLLARNDLGHRTADAIEHAVSWTEHFPLTHEAEFIYKHIIGQNMLTELQLRRCMTYAISRLRIIAETSDASHLLKALLREYRASGHGGDEIVNIALKWLIDPNNINNYDYIFNTLLRTKRLDDDNWRRVAKIALSWLRINESNPPRDRAINSLINRAALLERDDLQYLMHAANGWLAENPLAEGRDTLERNLKKLQQAFAQKTSPR